MQNRVPSLGKAAILLLALSFLNGCGGGSSSSTNESSNNDGGGQTGGDTNEDTGAGETQPETGVEVQSVLAMAAPLSPVMRTGFEDGTTGVPAEAIQTFEGIDESVDLPNDWAALGAISDSRGGGYFEIQYESAPDAGDTTQRYAVLSPDPDDADNQTLSFWLQDENDILEDINTGWREARGRVQANFYENYLLNTYYQTVRVRFGRDFANLMDHTGTFDWLTIFEAWNGALWIAEEEYPFHLAVNVVKPELAAGSNLYFKAHGRSYVQGQGFVPHWSDTNEDFVVPLEQWMTLELYMREGDEENGLFYMTAQVDGGEKVELFNEQNTTQHPDDPTPEGFDYINPIKLYTLEPVLDIVNGTGGVMQIHWDDLEFGHTAN